MMRPVSQPFDWNIIDVTYEAFSAFLLFQLCSKWVNVGQMLEKQEYF